MRKSCVNLALILMLLSLACGRKESDWDFPSPNMKTEQVGDTTWYDVGEGMLARHSKLEDDESNVLVILPGISPESLQKYGEAKTLSLLSSLIFTSVCKEADGTYWVGDGEYADANSFIRRFRTKSGKPASVVIKLDRQNTSPPMAVVILNFDDK